MTTAQTEARAILRIDDKWSVEYDPSHNDRPGRVLRYGDPVAGGSSDWKNDTYAMFCAVLTRDAEVAALKKEAADVVRPFAEQSRRFDKAAMHFNHPLAADDTRPLTDFKHGELRAASSFLDKLEGRDG